MTISTGTGGVLPLVPLSPLVKSSILAKEAYALASDKLAQARQATLPSTDVNSLRRLIEDTKAEHRRLESCELQMESVQFATAFNWDSNVLARQIAAVDCQLFGMVMLEKKWLCELDRHQTHLDRMLDFHRYLIHSFAHQLIYWTELSTNTTTSVVAPVPAVNPKDNLVQHFVRVAYLLAHAYRDFNGFAAVMRALMMPEVRRLRRLWQAVPIRTREVYDDLATLLSPADHYAAYHDALRRKLDLFSGRSGVIAVPWIQPHLAFIQSITKEYGTGSFTVLSAPGARKLSAAVELLELCKQGSRDPAVATSNSKKRVSLKPIHLEGLRSTIVPPGDLNRLLPGDLIVHHWLVSRVYLSRTQLMDESILVEPLAEDETLRRDHDQEEYEIEEIELTAAAAEDVVQDIALYPTSAQSRPSSIGGTRGGHHQQTKSLSSPLQQQQQEQPQVLSSSNRTQREKESSTGVMSPVNPEAEVPKGKAESQKTPIVEMQSHDKSMEDNPKSSSEHSRELSQGSSKKSRLSPTAPEFVPSSKFLVVPPGVTSTTVVSARSEAATKTNQGECEDVNDDDDEDDEEWRGYLYYEHKGETNPQAWSGYPSPPMCSSQSDHSEEWKGYHAYKMEEDWQQEINRKVEDHEWQGYALETLNEDELDSSTMLNGEFEKSRQARRQRDTLDAFRRVNQKH
ncbi:hypothetical protein BX666DRAFT_1904010 [Dichotomocladium elegans]|nr:hypothetical protein BX666DRAFT_1904010 [Dichotomocladium elegans]